MILILACEDANRVWDNPYDPRSDRSLWTPDTLQATQLSSDKIELSWLRKGRDFDGFKIDKKVGEENWQDSVAILWDSTFRWIDTLDLKEVVQNPVDYSYRVYAYADSNTSNKISVSIKPNVPGPPGSVNVLSVLYTLPPNEILTVNWDKSIEGDFAQYNLYHGITETGVKSFIRSIDNINTTTFDTNSFTPLQENWYWIEVEDTTGQRTLGTGKGHPVDSAPSPVTLDSITYTGGQFFFKWSKSPISDFEKYVIEQISLPDSTVLDSSVQNTQANTDDSIKVENDKEQYFRIRVMDKWNQSAWSKVRGGSSYQKVVKVDFIRDLGDDITIANLGPTLPFTHLLSNANAQFPIWIQKGEKVFSLIDGGVGLIVNENGINLRPISGEEPQDIAFNSDQSMAVFTGADHNIYLVNLNEDQSPSKLTSTSNNEWYGDPEFILGGSQLMYWQRKHQANNNVGVKDIFTMDLDGKNVKQITIAQNVDKFIMPRMSPDNSKILYVLEADGLYIMNYPGDTLGVEVTKEDGQKIIPVTSQYFRNIRWSHNGEKAILWSFENNSYFLYLFTLGGTPELTLLQSGGRYADWINDANADTVIFRSETSDAMFIKDVSASSDKEPTIFYNAPWAQLQPRQ
ncbi:MAG: hypothetical protein ISR82_06215 [Candidatus Marinimicrobia bacterium]|nr:hypothetical protein [Candidatus Neomarinimicrobiota bacterium]